MQLLVLFFNLRYRSTVINKGFLDNCTTTYVRGWAVEGGKPAQLEVVIDGTVVAAFVCDRRRDDLARRGLAENAGFHLRFAAPLPSKKTVEVRFRNGEQLRGSPGHAEANEGIVLQCTSSSVSGWALAEGSPARVLVRVGDGLLAEVPCDRPHPSLEAMGLPAGGFQMIFPRPLGEDDRVSVSFPDGTLLRGSPSVPELHEGRLEFCSIARVAGWALLGGRQAELEVFVDGSHAGTVRSGINRPSLAASLITADAAFHHEFPRSIDPTALVSVRHADGTELPGSPRRPAQSYPNLIPADPRASRKPLGNAPASGTSSRARITATGRRSEPEKPKRLFVLEDEAVGGRRYDQLLYRAIAEARGFFSVSPATLCFEDRIRIIGGATHIVATPGPSMARLAAFMNGRGKVCLLARPARTVAFLENTLARLRIEAASMHGGEDDGEVFTAAEFARFLDRWLSETP